ncbi:PAS domain-containing protein [Sulfuricurvum sp.]|uniref:PAS domain-containing protein n=1 Tax=Sulfuricurvum sp. TaxID=2025608 RepID=UPI003BB74A7A
MANNEITFDERLFIVSKTDLKGKITYGNELFIAMSGFSEGELIDAPHNILRHPEMPKVIFKALWDAIQSKNEIFAYVKNKTKGNDYYWVFAHVTPSLDEQGNIIGYHSVRRKPTPKALETIKPLYQKLHAAEISGGVTASQKILTTLLESEGVSYDEFILSF